MTDRPAARPVGQVRRRSPRVRRRSAGLTAARAGGLLTMIAAAAAIYGLTTSPVFGLDRLVVSGAVLTPDADLAAALAVPGGTNLVTLDTADAVARLEALPTIRRATIAAGLPGTLQVALDERQPILAWAVDGARYLVDVDGRVIAALGSGDALPRVDRDGRILAAGAAGGTSIPVVADRRTSGASVAVGGSIDPVDLDAARRLGSLQPADIGSDATALTVSISDQNGFVVRPAGGDAAGWIAVFGFYTSSDAIRPPTIVPDQVRLLRSLLAGRERQVERVTLASATEGTYVPRPSPSPSPSATP